MGRYANTIHRQLVQTMNELERLQRRRLGETVPAPVAIDVTITDLNEELMDELQGPHNTAHPVGVLSVPASGHLIGAGNPETAGENRPAFFSNADAVQFCETNTLLEKSRKPDRL